MLVTIGKWKRGPLPLHDDVTGEASQAQLAGEHYRHAHGGEQQAHHDESATELAHARSLPPTAVGRWRRARARVRYEPTRCDRHVGRLALLRAALRRLCSAK
jgi:hypothetical protein